MLDDRRPRAGTGQSGCVSQTLNMERDDLPKHLDLIQTVIERHARTSFLLKGWSVTLVAAVFLLAVRGNGSAVAMLVGLLPWLIFWGLDAYYLRQERMYRALYDHVRLCDPDPHDRFTLDARRFGRDVANWPTTLFATPVVWLHLAVLVMVLAAFALLSRSSALGA